MALGGEALATDGSAAEEPKEDLSRGWWPMREGRDFADAYKIQRRAYYDAAEAKGLRRIWEIAYCQYYGLNPAAVGDMMQTLAFVGENKQFLRFRIGKFRAFIKQQIGMARGERPAFKAQGTNTDYATGAQIQASDQIISYLYQTGTGESLEGEALEANAVVGMGSAHTQWDYDGGHEVDVELPAPEGGNVYDFQTGQLVPATITTQKKSGMPMSTMAYPWETPCNPNVRNNKHAWRGVRARENKFELGELYQEHKQALQSMQFEHDEFTAHTLFGFDLSVSTEDDIMVDHVYVAPCRLVPNGRYVGLAQDVVLWDEECPLDEIPIVDMCSARYMGAHFGYCENWDLIPTQEMRDQLCSDAASNFTKFGRPMIVADEGLQLDQRFVGRGHFIWTKPQGTEAPTAVEINPMPPGFMEFLEYLHRQDDDTTAQSSVSRGQPNKDVNSAQMAALYHNNTLEFRSGEQAALFHFRKTLANQYLNMTRRFADAPFLAEIAGQSERPFMKQFTVESLSGIKRVILEPVSPLSRSAAGRIAMAELLMKIEDPKMRAALQKGIETGQWGDFCKKERNSDLRVQWENEQLAQGIPCRVLSSDHPWEHIPGHLADIDARTEQLNGDPEAVNAYLEHVLEHLMQYQNINPNMARVLGIPLPLPIAGTPTGDANMMMTGPAEPVPEAGAPPMDAVQNVAKTSVPMQQQGRDASGVKLPKPGEPPPQAETNKAA